jgi:predicted Ser/Thr protein kinase
MSQDESSLKNLLGALPPIAETEISFEQFLQELKKHPERASTAHAVVLAAIEKMGVEKVEDETDPERKQYLQMLEELGYKSYLAFKHVSGSQKFVREAIVAPLTSAIQGGEELKRFLVVEGPSGSGKDFIADGIFAALENSARVYVVKGSPDYESPLNLLKLFERKHKDVLKKLAEETGLGDKLFALLKVALPPGKFARELVLGSRDEPNTKPNFDKVKVVALDISPATLGISKWEPGDNHTLVQAMRQANRGFLNLPDAFIHREIEPGKTDERLTLMSAPQYRRLAGATEEPNGVPPPSPLDTFIMATTNRIALEKFLETLPDAEAFTRRAIMKKKPHNLIRVEEVRAYKQIWENFEQRPALDPLVLKIVATLAIVSRQAVPKTGQPFVHPIDRMRLYQGENFIPKPRQSGDWSKLFDTSGSSSSYDRYGQSDFGGRMSSSGSSDEASGMKLPEGKQISTGLLWGLGTEEGMAGLDMRFMPMVLSKLKNWGLMRKDQCVNSIHAILLLRAIIAQEMKTSNLTKEQKDVYARCLKWLGVKPGMPTDLAALELAEIPSIGTDTPELIESEFRRMLRDMFITAFAPDYNERAQSLFTKYRLHAPVIFEGKETTVKDPSIGSGRVPLDVGLVDELDRYRLEKGKDAFLSDEDKSFRGKLDAYIGVLREQWVAEHGPEKAKEFKVDWETIPELSKAIRGKLDAEIGALMQKLIDTEVTSDLGTLQQEQLVRAISKLNELGFCEKSRKPILEYAKKTKIWSFKSE